MSLRASPRSRRAAFALAALAAFGLRPLVAERLALRRFTTEDGLTGDSITALVLDRAGGLWIGTSTGLSRYDGASFTNLGPEEGLPHPFVSALASVGDGWLYVAASEHLLRLRPEEATGPSPLEAVELPAGAGPIEALLAGRDGGLWIGAGAGLFRLDAGSRHPRAIELGEAAGLAPVSALAEADDGALWIGGVHGLARRDRAGAIRRWSVREIQDNDTVHGLLIDPAGLVWVAHGAASLVFRPERGDPGPTPLAARTRRAAGQPGAGLPAGPGEVLLLAPDDGVWGLDSRREPLRSRDGRIWLPSNNLGLFAFDGAAPVARYDGAEGTPGADTTAMVEDAEGNLWLGSVSGGLYRWNARGPRTLGAQEGLPEPARVAAIVESRAHELVLALHRRDGERSRLALMVEDDGRFRDISPPALAQLAYAGWGWSQTLAEDGTGGWWLATGEGALSFPPVGRATALAGARALEITASGMRRGEEVFRLYRDRADGIWLSLVPGGRIGHWRRGGALERHDTGWASTRGGATAFAEDRSGHLWAGFYEGGLARWDGERFLRFGPEQGAPDSFVYELLPGDGDALWVASASGLFRVEAPGAPAPAIRRVPGPGERAVGGATSIAPDGFGALLIGTRRGLERFDPATGSVERLGTESGLPESRIMLVRRDRTGRVWIATRNALAVWTPGPVRRLPPPRVRILGLRVDGEPIPLPLAGAAALGAETPIPVRHAVEISFGASRLSGAADLRYSYRLAAGAGGWSAPSISRSVHLAGLPPGRHRFEVRLAGAPDLEASVAPALIELRVTAPLWRRPEFAAALLAALLLGGALAYRARVRRLLALERVRTRIATDLHDDLGASLARISVLAELGRMQLGAQPERAAELLGEIGDTARELSETTGDIVWSIDPRHDDFASLLARLRRFASDLLEGQGIRLDFPVPADAARLPLAPETRRELYLILKEAIHNAARHAGATRVAVTVAERGDALVARVEDDGRGLDPERVARRREEGGGHGLTSMAARAEMLGGRLSVTPREGGGTVVEAELPVRL